MQLQTPIRQNRPDFRIHIFATGLELIADAVCDRIWRVRGRLVRIANSSTTKPRAHDRQLVNCVSVCLSVCHSVREHISGTAGPIFTKFLCRSLVAVARYSSGGVAICYVLPVLWMTPHLTVLRRMATSGVAIPRRSLISMNVSLVLFSSITERRFLTIITIVLHALWTIIVSYEMTF